MYATANLYDRYKQDYVVTASPMDLILMLYDGCIKQCKLAKIYIEGKEIEATCVALNKAQDIVLELLKSLDFSFAISKDLMLLYDYMLNQLMQVNIKKETEALDPIIDILVSLKEAWITVKSGSDTMMISETTL